MFLRGIGAVEFGKIFTTRIRLRVQPLQYSRAEGRCIIEFDQSSFEHEHSIGNKELTPRQRHLCLEGFNPPDDNR